MFHHWRSFRPSFLAEKRCAETIGEHMTAVIPRSQSTAEPSDTERQCWRSLWRGRGEAPRYHRISHGPNRAPIAVGISIPITYHVPRNGAASSGQWSV